jgi:hypothetical protein
MTTSGLLIERADEGHLVALAPLFAAYRRFYGRADDLRAGEFLAGRLTRGGSVVFTDQKLRHRVPAMAAGT